MSQMGPLSTPWSVEETEQDEAVSGRLDVVRAGQQTFSVAQEMEPIKTTTASLKSLQWAP